MVASSMPATPRLRMLRKTSQSELIECDGAALVVSTSCKALLQALAETDIEGPFWMKDICIDIGHTQERDEQIAQFRNIYAHARSTIVYLGNHNVQSTDMMMDLYDEIPVSKASLDDFFSRPWFFQLWSMPEGLLSRGIEFIIGSAEVEGFNRAHLVLTLDQLNTLVTAAEGLGIALPPLLRAERRLQRRGCNQEHMPFLSHIRSRGPAYSMRSAHTQDKRGRFVLPLHRILESMNISRELQCQDPRDKIFAILALFKDSIPDAIAFDYSKSLEEVYINFAWFCINWEIPEILQSCQCQPVAEGLPSWVVDWRAKLDCPPLMSSQHKEGSANSAWEPQWSAGWQDGHKQTIAERVGTKLVLRGVLVGSVEWIGTPSKLDSCTEQYTLIQAEGQIDSWSEDIQLQSAQEHSDRDAPSEFKEMMSDGVRTGSDDSVQSLIQRCINRRPIIISDDKLGLAPASVSEGDLACVFLGFPTPFLLREVEGKMRVVGSCIIQGTMYGEAVQSVKWEVARDEVLALPLQDFEIV